MALAISTRQKAGGRDGQVRNSLNAGALALIGPARVSPRKSFFKVCTSSSMCLDAVDGSGGLSLAWEGSTLEVDVTYYTWFWSFVNCFLWSYCING